MIFKLNYLTVRIKNNFFCKFVLSHDLFLLQVWFHQDHIWDWSLNCFSPITNIIKSFYLYLLIIFLFCRFFISWIIISYIYFFTMHLQSCHYRSFFNPYYLRNQILNWYYHHTYFSKIKTLSKASGVCAKTTNILYCCGKF